MTSGLADPRPPTVRSIISIHRKYLFILIACIGIVYAQTLRFDFVTYDDYELVYQNSNFLSDLSNVFTSFRTHAFTTHREVSGYYRPLLLVSYILDYHAWQLNPLGYHLSNMFLHILAALFVFVLIISIINDPTVALLGSLLFALHPVQTESVAWVAGRNDVLLGLFVVVMALCYHFSHENEISRKKYLALALVAFACALFTKESAAFYLLLLPLYDLCFRRAEFRTLFSIPSIKRLVPFIIVLLVYLGIRLSVLGELIGAEKLYGASPMPDRLKEIPVIVSEHLKFIFYPARLSIVHPLEHLLWVGQPWSFVAYGVTLLLPILIWRAWHSDRIICFGLSWFALGLVPILGIFPLAVPILEHRLYLPLVGIAIVFGRLVQLTCSKWKSKITLVAPGAVIVACAVCSFVRLPVWENSETMWQDAIDKAPDVSRSYFNLAGYYFEHQQYDRTIDLMKKYVELKPDDFMGYSKLRQTLFLTGRVNEASRVNRLLINRSPHSSNRYLEAASMYEQLNELDSAAALYAEGLSVDSSFYDLRAHLGLVRERQGRFSDAEVQLKRAVELQPRFAPSLFSIGMFYARRQQTALAAQYLEEGLKYGTPSPEVVQTLSDIYTRAGQTSKAQDLLGRYQQ